MQNLIYFKTVIRIGTPNVRPLYETGKSAQVVREMDKYGVEVLGLSEVRWTASSPNEGDDHRNGVGIMPTEAYRNGSR